MKPNQICHNCSKHFYAPPNQIQKGGGKYCSTKCYFDSRWAGNGKCKTCGKPTKTQYCSRDCQKDYWNKNDYHLRKKKRQWETKMAILEKLGGKCSQCGNADIRVLDINHKDRKKKTIPKHRHYTWQKRIADWKKNIDSLEILCANCHRIHTWEQMKYGVFMEIKPAESD